MEERAQPPKGTEGTGSLSNGPPLLLHFLNQAGILLFIYFSTLGHLIADSIRGREPDPGSGEKDKSLIIKRIS